MPTWAIPAVVIALWIAQLIAIVVLAKQASYWKAVVRNAERDLNNILRIQGETNQPLPTDSDSVRELMDDS